MKIYKDARKSAQRGERGAVLVMVAGSLFVLIAVGALAVDIGYIMVIKNELQNAADAGALWGARVLFLNQCGVINPSANQEAYDAALANLSQNTPVEIDFDAGDPNSGDIQRGHWSFATRTFTPNDSLTSADLWGATMAQLDANPNHINAIRVRVRRQATPAYSFLARIFGVTGMTSWAEAVGYRGPAGKAEPHDFDQPIAICRQAIIDPNGAYTCNTGRMIDSSGGTTTNTGGWSNFSQPCQTASKPTVEPLICANGNPRHVLFGIGMGTTGGMVDTVYNDLRDCWLNRPVSKDFRGYPIESWSWTLPVIDCPGNNVLNCSNMVGIVTVNVLWIKQSGADPQWTDIPVQMDGWECSVWAAMGRPTSINALTEAQRFACWSEFGNRFELRTWDGTPISSLTHSQVQKTILFKPDCSYHEPKGHPSGEYYGVCAEYPVLVN